MKTYIVSMLAIANILGGVILCDSLNKTEAAPSPPRSVDITWCAKEVEKGIKSHPDTRDIFPKQCTVTDALLYPGGQFTVYTRGCTQVETQYISDLTKVYLDMMSKTTK